VQADPLAWHWPFVPHDADPWSAHTLLQQTRPPAATGAQDACRHCVASVHAVPSGSSWHVPAGQ
jgi:hypothetical protein